PERHGVEDAAAPRRGRLQEFLSRERQNEQRDASRLAHELLDELEEAGGTEVQIFEHEDDGSSLGESAEEREEPRADLRDPIGPALTRLLVDAERNAESSRGLFDLGGVAAPLDDVVELLTDDVRR